MDRIIKKVLRNYLREAAEMKPGSTVTIPGSESIGRKFIRAKYGLNPDDFEYLGSGRFQYKPKGRSSTPRQSKPKKQKVFLGRKEGETEQDYLERVRELNKKFADVEAELPDEQWRPVKNTGRYFGGSSDYSRSHEVSNMGRMRTIDFNDPMRSRISTGYDAPTRNSRQFHLDTFDDNGEAFKTTPPIHTLVADAWLEPPEGNIEDYDVEHIDGNYHNNRADNLRYVLRKGRRGRKPEVAESKINRIIKRVINEVKYGTIENAEQKSEYFSEILEKVDNLIDDIKSFDTNGRMMGDALKHAQAIKSILQRKTSQHRNFKDNLEDVDIEKFENDFEDEDITNQEMSFLRRNY